MLTFPSTSKNASLFTAVVLRHNEAKKRVSASLKLQIPPSRHIKMIEDMLRAILAACPTKNAGTFYIFGDN